MSYCDSECFALAKDVRDLMRRVSEASKRDTLTLAQRIAIKDVAHVLDAQSRKLLDIEEPSKQAAVPLDYGEPGADEESDKPMSRPRFTGRSI